MKYRDSVKTALSSLTHAKTRTALTMLGIVIGISSVILLLSIGTSAQNYILNQVQSIGSNLVFVIPGATKGSRFASPASVQGIIIKTLNEQDLNSFKQEPSIKRATAQVNGQAKVIYGNNDATVTYQGTTGDFFPIRNFKVTDGVVFANSDVESFNHVAVIGSSLAATLFGPSEPVGKQIRLQNLTFTVIGVLEKKGLGPLGIDQDNLVLMPISVAQKQLLGIDYYTAITVEGNDAYTIEFVKSRMTSLLRQNHNVPDPSKDDFTIRTQEDSLALLGNITSVLTLFLTAIASISLVVGGIGIMNIMLVSVIERTKEIGLRKAVGATNGDILQQFLIESVMLTFLGGAVGIFIGSLFVVLVYLGITTFSPETGWTFALPLSAVLLGVGVSTFTGIIFGIYPARQAAKKNPIEALRYE
jgi:putative ABC transport system permease protein